MTLTFVLELVVSLLLVASGVFVLVGSIGLVKLPDMMTRLHGPTKATTLGVGSALIASMLYFWFFRQDLSAHELLITLFLFLSAPLTANLIAKAYLHRTEDAAKRLPPPAGDVGWATFDPPPTEAGDEPAADSHSPSRQT